MPSAEKEEEAEEGGVGGGEAIILWRDRNRDGFCDVVDRGGGDLCRRRDYDDQLLSLLSSLRASPSYVAGGKRIVPLRRLSTLHVDAV